MREWNKNVSELGGILEKISVMDKDGKEIGPDEGFNRWRDLTFGLRESGRKCFLAGNGASASMASHVAVDLAKNGKVQTEIFTDLSLITAVSNDISYEEVFAEPLRWKMGKGDMLVAISSSGRSLNVIRGAEVAKQKGGVIITLSAMGADNPLRKMGDINLYIPAESYGMAETGHAAILHYWIDLVVAGA